MTSKNYEVAVEKFRNVLSRSETKEGIRNIIENRDAVLSRYQPIFSPENIPNLSEEDFRSFLYFENNRHWSGLYRKGLAICDDMQLLRESLMILVNPRLPLSQRFNESLSKIKGFGTAMTTEMMALVHPNECGLWNTKARTGLVALGFDSKTVPLKKSQISGEDYQRFNDVLRLIQRELSGKVEEKLDLLGVDYFLYEIWRANREQGDEAQIIEIPASRELTDFDHDEVIEQLVAIGEWMGFQAKKEQPIARGAKVDALWQAQIANLGKVTYVFEVQRRGSLDSLILNLQRAQNNPSVQRLIIVANAKDLARVKQEIEALPESFRRMVSYMEVWEAKRAAELVSELSEIISKLELVKSEYGT